jgi:hypothetical protein
MKVSKRFLDRASKNLRKYQKVLEAARSRDVGESDIMGAFEGIQPIHSLPCFANRQPENVLMFSVASDAGPALVAFSDD